MRTAKLYLFLVAFCIALSMNSYATDPLLKNKDVLLNSGISPEEVEKKPYAEYVIECIDLLMKYGTDRYGWQKLPLLVTYLDVRSRTCPENPPFNKPYWRGQIRECFWKPRGSDLLVDQSTIEVMYLLSKLTGKKKYQEFADDYIRCAMTLTDEKGFFWWGWHRYYNVFQDKLDGSNGNHHEIHINRPRWQMMYELDREATLRELEAIWKWHVVDKKTGEHNRHDEGKPGCDFAMSGGEFIYSLAFLYSKTNDETYLKGAKSISEYYWKSRNKRTGLIPNRPNAGRKRFDGSHFDTSITGMHSYFLLKSYELYRIEGFRDKALAYLRAYARYGYDVQAGEFWGSINLNGKPEEGPRAKEGYEAQEPRGYIDYWQPYQLGYEYAPATAQIYAYAYQLTKDEVMLETARKWADCFREHPPSEGCRFSPTTPGYAEQYSKYGAFAESYGRVISFYTHMYALTGEDVYLDDARQLAREAVSKLYFKGLFRGHPAKPYYGSVDGVGFLLYSLLQLDRVLKHTEVIVNTETIPIHQGSNEAISFDNW